MAQVEDPANLDRCTSPAYQLITVILIRCGLRITERRRPAPDCVVRDAGGAPYLRYYNTKMKREALVPIDEELRAMIAAQQDRDPERWPAAPRCCSPARTPTSTAPARWHSHLPVGAAIAGWSGATSATSTASPST